MNWLHRLPIVLLLLYALSLLLGLTDAAPNMTGRVKRSAAKVLLKKKGLATAALVAAASISKKKFLPIPIPFPLPILKPPIIEPIPIPFGFGKFGGGFGGFGGGFG